MVPVLPLVMTYAAFVNVSGGAGSLPADAAGLITNDPTNAPVTTATRTADCLCMAASPRTRSPQFYSE